MSEQQQQQTNPTIVNVEPTEPSTVVEEYVEEEEENLPPAEEQQQTTHESSIEPSAPEVPATTYTEIQVPNFWGEGAFKRVTKRIDDGARVLEDLSKMIHERAEIENLYATKIRGKYKNDKDILLNYFLTGVVVFV